LVKFLNDPLNNLIRPPGDNVNGSTGAPSDVRAGAGFIVGGYCPGTSIAALATGRKDGLAFALGMLAGVMAYAEFTPGIEAWIKAGSLGELTLPTLTGIGMGWWVLVFVAVLAGAAWGMRGLERRFAHLEPRP
ncbi:MAG: hypothetical protein GX886_16560, partial [Comamonadaceae bacterium]|nr:hypothetical protein [Comamonadaceae bacterium]